MMVEPVTLSVGLYMALNPPSWRTFTSRRRMCAWARKRKAVLVDVLREEAPDAVLDAIVNHVSIPTWSAALLWLALWVVVFVV